MEKEIILITGSVLSSNDESKQLYKKIINIIKLDKTKILSPLDTMKFNGNDYERYNRAMHILKETKKIIAEVSIPSTGQGMELQQAINLNIPILLIAKNGTKVSSLLKGCNNIEKLIYYDNIEDIKEDILEYIK